MRRSTARTTRWALHSAGPDLPADGPGPKPDSDPSLPDVHGWLELRDETLVGTTLRLAGLLPGRTDRSEDLARCHFRFQAEVVRLDEGILIAEGQVGMGGGLEPGVARLCLGRLRLRDGSEWLDVRFRLTSDDAFPDGLEVDLTAVRPRLTA